MRAFVSIRLDDAIKAAISGLQERLVASFGGAVRATPYEQIHLTVKFLGEVQDERLEEIKDALDLAAASASAFCMRVSGVGSFPPSGPVRIVWAGFAGDGGALEQCWNALESEMAALGFAREDRGFTPHATLARIKDDHNLKRLRRFIESESLPELSQNVDSLELAQSVLSREGAQHTVIHEARLGSN